MYSKVSEVLQQAVGDKNTRIYHLQKELDEMKFKLKVGQMCACMWEYVCMYVCMYSYVCIYVYRDMCVYVCIEVSMCICVLVHMHFWLSTASR